MENLDYNTIFKAAYEMLKDLSPLKAETNKNYLKKQEEKLFVDYFESFIMSQKVNIQGHNKGKFDGKTLTEIKNEFEYEHLTSRCCDQIKFAISYKLFSPIMKELDALKLDANGSVKDAIIQQFTRFLDSSILESEHYCFVCGMNSKIGLTKDGYSNIVDPNSRMAQFSAYHACPHPKGIEQYSNVVKVPSGTLMFANDLRCLFPDADSKSDSYIIERSGYYNSICSELGMLYNTEFWNKLGLVYVQVGNTSPQIVKNTKTGVISVKMNNKHDDDYEYDYEEKGEHYTVKKYTSNEEYCGRISTSLWAVCAMDLELMKLLCTQHNIDFETLSKECVQVSVEPGDYIVHSFNAVSYADKHTFFNIKKVT